MTKATRSHDLHHALDGVFRLAGLHFFRHRRGYRVLETVVVGVRKQPDDVALGNDADHFAIAAGHNQRADLVFRQ